MMKSRIQRPTTTGLNVFLYPPQSQALTNVDELEPLERAWHHTFRREWDALAHLLHYGSVTLHQLEQRCGCSLWSLFHDIGLKDGLRRLAQDRYGGIDADDFRDLVGRAAEAGQIDMIKFYLDENITSIQEIESATTSKRQPLHRAKTAEVVDFLISKGANVNFKATIDVQVMARSMDLTGATPLFSLTRYAVNNEEPLYALLASPDVDKMAQLDDGNTLLHFAVLYCSPTILEPLLDMGFNNEVKNAEGFTARELAMVRETRKYSFKNSENIIRDDIFNSWDRAQIKKANKKRQAAGDDAELHASDASLSKRAKVASPLFHTTSAEDVQASLWMDREWLQLFPGVRGRASRSEFVVYDFFQLLQGTSHLLHAARVANSAWEKIKHYKFSTELDFCWQPFIIEAGTTIKNKHDMIRAVCKALGAPDATPVVKTVSVSTTSIPTGDSSEDGVLSAVYFLRKEAKNVMRIDFVHESVNTYPILVVGVDKRESDGESVIVGVLAIAHWT